MLYVYLDSIAYKQAWFTEFRYHCYALCIEQRALFNILLVYFIVALYLSEFPRFFLSSEYFGRLVSTRRPLVALFLQLSMSSIHQGIAPCQMLIKNELGTLPCASSLQLFI